MPKNKLMRRVLIIFLLLFILNIERTEESFVSFKEEIPYDILEIVSLREFKYYKYITPKIQKIFKEVYFKKKLIRDRYIEVEIPENKLRLYVYLPEKDKYRVLKEYTISPGRPSLPTPIGEGYIYSKGIVYFYKPDGSILEYAHDKDGSEFKIDYNKIKGFFFIVNHNPVFTAHATTEYWLIGYPVSHGCIRLLPEDAMELYKFIVPIMKIKIIYRVFKMRDDRVVIYPDIYNMHADFYKSFEKFMEKNGFPSFVLNKAKIKTILYEVSVSYRKAEVRIDEILKYNFRYPELVCLNRSFFNINRHPFLNKFFKFF